MSGVDIGQETQAVYHLTTENAWEKAVRALAAQPHPSSAGRPVQEPMSAPAALGRGRGRGGRVPGGQPLPQGFSFTVACPPARPCPHFPNYAPHEPSVFPASTRGNSPNPRSSMHLHSDGLEVCPQAGTCRELTLVHPWLWTHAGGAQGHPRPTHHCILAPLAQDASFPAQSTSAKHRPALAQAQAPGGTGTRQLLLGSGFEEEDTVIGRPTPSTPRWPVPGDEGGPGSEGLQQPASSRRPVRLTCGSVHAQGQVLGP